MRPGPIGRGDPQNEPLDDGDAESAADAAAAFVVAVNAAFAAVDAAVAACAADVSSSRRWRATFDCWRPRSRRWADAAANRRPRWRTERRPAGM